MTMIGPMTTCTTVINLGGATPIATEHPPTASPPLVTDPPSARSPSPQLVNPTEEKSDSGLVAGALIGSACGFFILLFILYACCTRSRSRTWSTTRSSRYYGSSQSSLGSYGRGSSRSSRLHFRGGGGSDWEGGNHRVRRPEKARVRGQRRTMSENDSDAVSSSRSHRRRRSGRRGSKVSNGSGLAGWYFKSMSGASSRGNHESERRRNAWRDGRARIQTLDD
ncbi:uncharacterized protein BP5553_03823 [Venustampulla echinocandica]|uniref:Uncharacterized protein n=1 Tax=Venustampulla echinocandica TaxID=2656787 RepID=A0A370TVC3_9HELO|nr:uncharacterized protein BP5553_03823 [Venustampulla echinocandica]RDL39483.1 hypothetical protein BP5553_03823 [Venustampulla echinocandica]